MMLCLVIVTAVLNGCYGASSSAYISDVPTNPYLSTCNSPTKPDVWTVVNLSLPGSIPNAVNIANYTFASPQVDTYAVAAGIYEFTAQSDNRSCIGIPDHDIIITGTTNIISFTQYTLCDSASLLSLVGVFTSHASR